MKAKPTGGKKPAEMPAKGMKVMMKPKAKC